MNNLCKYFYNIYFLISISILIRFLLIDFYGDKTLENEWGILFNNLYFNNIFAYRVFENQLIPTLYMPPLYAYIILFIKYVIPNDYNLVFSVLVCQIFVASITLYFYYRINLFFLSKKLSIFSSILFSFFPLYIYASLQISSIIFQIFFNLVFLYLFLKLIERKTNSLIEVILGIICGLLILLRGEFIIIFFASLLYLFFFKILRIKQFFLIIVTCLLVLSPYLIRNYIVFEKITLTKSLGYNLWKGNNLDSNVEGSETNAAFEDGDLILQIKSLPKDKYYDINYDEIFLKKSVSFIKEDPILFFQRYLKKFLSFTFLNLDSKYPNYYNLLNILPLFLVSFLFALSIFFCYQKKSISYNFLVLNLFLTIAIFSLFFILPRYKLIIIPMQLIIINICFSYFLKKFKFSYKKDNFK